MSQKALEQFDIACKELLEEQRQCAWCNRTFGSLETLVQHITAEHPKDETGNRH